LQFYTSNGVTIDPNGEPSNEPIELEMTRIPFVLLDIGDSIIKDVVDHQCSLLNLGSADVAYAMKSNFPFLTKQEDTRAAGSYLKQADNERATAAAGGQPAGVRNLGVAPNSGMIYPMDANQPAFINPSAEPLRVSMELQQNLKDDIRTLVNLAVQTLASRASAESKALDNQGLEAGLSYIGLVLENGERLLSEYWAAYESIEPAGRQVATIKYPDRYSLKTDDDRITEATKLSKLLTTVPGQTVKREIAKSIVQSLLGGKVSAPVISQINDEIDAAECTTSDPNTILAGVEKGLIDPETGSVALGCNPGTAAKAQKAHIKRMKAIAAAQGIIGSDAVPAGEDVSGGDQSNGPVAQGQPPTGDPAARGVPDLSGDLDAGALEKADSRNAGLGHRADTTPRVRGKGKKLNKKKADSVDAPDSPVKGNFFQARQKDWPQRKPFA